MSVNYIRLVVGFILISLFTAFSRGMFLPLDATANAWIWLSASGFVGFVIGDLFLFQAYIEIGSRISMLIMALVPPITAFLGFITMREVISFSNFIGIAITIYSARVNILSFLINYAINNTLYKNKKQVIDYY